MREPAVAGAYLGERRVSVPDLLEVDGLAAGYLGDDVVHDVDLTVGEGEAVAIIGSNGAGKSTLFRAICGLLRRRAATVRFEGRAISGHVAHTIARLGLAYVPAERHLFPQMTVRENLALGAYPRRPDGDRRALVLELFPRLGERCGQRAATMSGGEQQMLAVGRALMSQPRLLMLDEPTTGLAPKLAAEAYAALAALRDRRASPSSSPSSRCRWPSGSPSGRTSWRTAGSSCTGRRGARAQPRVRRPTWVWHESWTGAAVALGESDGGR